MAAAFCNNIAAIGGGNGRMTMKCPLCNNEMTQTGKCNICKNTACELYAVEISNYLAGTIRNSIAAADRRGREDVIGWLERWETETYVDGFQEMQAGAHQAAKEARHYFGLEPK